jgi:hypothetical protein
MRRAALAQLILLAALSVMTARAAAAAPEDKTSLSLRTSDGLVVVSAPAPAIDYWRNTLSGIKNPPVSNAGVFKWLSQHGAPPSSIRVYFDAARQTQQPPKTSAPSWKKNTVRKAVEAGLIPCVEGKELFEAYLLIRLTGEDVFIEKKAVAAAAVSPVHHSIFILSSAYGNGLDGILIDGVNYPENVNGYNIVTISPDGSAVTTGPEAEGFALYDTPDDARRMAEFLSGQPDGAYAVAAVKMGPGVFLSSDSVSALRKYGSREALDPQLLSSHAMFGRKGWAPGAARETTAVNLGTKIILFDSDALVGEDELGSVSPRISSGAVLLTGTHYNDPIYIFK